ncbi:tryptophan 7-halogenase [Microbulbifer sp. SH-1]|uniref:tryptophan halogenase family protein n=1 Tax=Microbulbifer sp. SH-1 TaxID=2681547 RepID=UPI00140D1E5F|nr:tryptophan halogenase family protein [Microbulbifer sp. SH-1]QIL89796.1 tryptophan 7-halogenase [Microbulbifer sp. SH-1]
MKIRKIAIVGGGTAGWMAANHLGVELASDPDIEITVIESQDVPAIGVGEGTVPRIKETLDRFGISEVAMLANCDTTFKTGIKFSNWMSAESGHDFYYHPFSAPFPQGFDVTDHWLSQNSGLCFSTLSESYPLSEQDRCPKRKSSPPYTGAVDYAYHFNAGKFSELIAENARRRFGVIHKFATVKDVVLREDGEIGSLVFSDGNSEEFDFYLDCSGFSAVLLGAALKTPFEDKSDRILTDSALVLQEPTAEDAAIHPYTTAHAHKAGWIWDIPLTNRRGLGCVYASKYMSDVEALGELSEYVGRSLNSGDVRKIPMKIGFRENFWRKNCVAFGLAQGFVEPLEATSILVTDFSANLLAKRFPRTRGDIPRLSEYCNKIVRYTWERVIDFVQLHYCISDRRDSQFWVDCTEGAKLSEELADRLGRWSIATPKSLDFFSAFDIFGVENYLYVLYGMKYSTRAISLSETEHRRAAEIVETANRHAEKLAAELMPQRVWLTELQKQLTRVGM